MVILVTGAGGMLGSAVVRAGFREGLEVIGLSKGDFDITDYQQVNKTLSLYEEPIVINCAGIVRGREDVDESRMSVVNTLGPYMLAQHASRLLQISTDCVFDGTLTDGAYDEGSQTHPTDTYGCTKLVGEMVHGPHLTVRVSFVGQGQRGLFQWLLSLPRNVPCPGYTNWWWNGWTAEALAPVLLDLAMKREITGLVHLPGPEVVTKAWLLTEVARRLRPDLMVIPCEAPTASRMVLATKHPWTLPVGVTWNTMLDELEEEYRS